MVKLKGQAFDTKAFYSKIDSEKLREYAEITGLARNRENLDASLLLKIISEFNIRKPRVLEVGCADGRVGKFLFDRNVDYFGIDMHKPYVDKFRAMLTEANRKKIFHGNFLTYAFPFNNFHFVLFPWSVIGDFSFDGQETALRKSRELLLPSGRICIDVPIDLVNKFEGYQPGPFNVNEVHDLQKVGLKYVKARSYQTLTRRNRKIIEIKLKKI